MPYQVKLTTSVSEVAKNFPPEIKKVAKSALKELAENPDLGKELQAELSNFRSYRFKRYRIVYSVDTNNKFVVAWYRAQTRYLRTSGRTFFTKQ